MIFRKECLDSPGPSVLLIASREIDRLREENTKLVMEINDLKCKFQGWDSMLERVKYLVSENEKLKKDRPHNRIPHKCPYCEQARFEMGIGFFFKCAPCNNTGIVWEPKL